MKALLAILLAGKFGKLLLSGGTMLVSVFAYALAYGWPYAVGFVVLLFFHELGHYLAARQRGLDVGLPTFIPFVGAWIQLKDVPHDAETEAYVGLAGPMVGSAAAFMLYIAAGSEGSRLLLAIAYAGFFLNLFNLLPITPLDGGRIVAVISPKIWLLGIPLLIGLFIWRPSPLLFIIALFAIPHAWRAIRNPEAMGSGYYVASKTTRIQYTLQYLLLTAFLAVMSFSTHESLEGAVGQL